VHPVMMALRADVVHATIPARVVAPVLTLNRAIVMGTVMAQRHPPAAAVLARVTVRAIVVLLVPAQQHLPDVAVLAREDVKAVALERVPVRQNVKHVLQTVPRLVLPLLLILAEHVMFIVKGVVRQIAITFVLVALALQNQHALAVAAILVPIIVIRLAFYNVKILVLYIALVRARAIVPDHQVKLIICNR